MKRLSQAAVLAAALTPLLLAVGVWGAWLPHKVAGLVILGVDLAEYVKFVPEVQSGAIPMARELFFLPQVALVGSLVLLASTRRVRLPLWARLLLAVLAVPVILSMLPPAWTPWLLKQPEFARQMRLMAALFAFVLLAPLWQRLGELPRAGLWLAVGLAPWWALRAYVALQPALENLYHHPLPFGLGFYATLAGALLALFTALFTGIEAITRRAKTTG